MTAPTVKIYVTENVNSHCLKLHLCHSLHWIFRFWINYYKICIKLAVFILTYSMLLQAQIYTSICRHLWMSFMCLLFLLLDPETGEEYMIRRGECVNVLPGILKKVQVQVWRVNTGRSDKFEYIYILKQTNSMKSLLHFYTVSRGNRIIMFIT